MDPNPREARIKVECCGGVFAKRLESVYIARHALNLVQLVSKPGPGSVALMLGTACSAKLVGSNLDVIDSEAHSEAF